MEVRGSVGQIFVVNECASRVCVECDLLTTNDAFRVLVGDLFERSRSTFWLVFRGRVLKGKWCLGTFGIRGANASEKNIFVDGVTVQCVPLAGCWQHPPKPVLEPPPLDTTTRLVWQDWK